MTLSAVGGEPVGGYRPQGPRRIRGAIQERRGRKVLDCQQCGGKATVEIYATDLASCQHCGAEYFVWRRRGEWSQKLIRPGRLPS